MFLCPALMMGTGQTGGGRMAKEVRKFRTIDKRKLLLRWMSRKLPKKFPREQFDSTQVCVGNKMKNFQFSQFFVDFLNSRAFES